MLLGVYAEEEEVASEEQVEEESTEMVEAEDEETEEETQEEESTSETATASTVSSEKAAEQKKVQSKKSLMLKGINVSAEVVNGVCPTCEMLTMLISLTCDHYRCITCGSDLKQYINGKISYIPAISGGKRIDLTAK